MTETRTFWKGTAAALLIAALPACGGGDAGGGSETAAKDAPKAGATPAAGAEAPKA
ncbi:MAG: hypothetical protein ICV87_04765, partial [Gemmatimonadetes bacterium]|nr:hypothetical protein [Gemmatimonadota bacterium]